MREQSFGHQTLFLYEHRPSGGNFNLIGGTGMRRNFNQSSGKPKVYGHTHEGKKDSTSLLVDELAVDLDLIGSLPRYFWQCIFGRDMPTTELPGGGGDYFA